MQVEFTPVERLVPAQRNAREHSEQQVRQIEDSILEWGWTVPILVDGESVVAGHGRLRAANGIYARGERLRLPSGDAIPVGTVPTIDCSGWTEEQRRAYVLADNKLAENASWDTGLLALEIGELRDFGYDVGLVGFSDKELRDLFADDTERYSRRIETPIYAPTGEEPPLSALLDDSREGTLLESIEAADVPEDVKAFLRRAAARHVAFDYAAIAEYYAHAPAGVQRLMEESALVIIDFESAIERGYVELTERLNGIYAEGYPRDDGDDEA